jgi:hypothetical protein
MDSFWLSLVAFVAGSYTGILLMALLYMSSRASEQHWRVVDARRASR